MQKRKQPNRNRSERWWSFRLNPADLANAGFEHHERGPEAEARHLAYVQNAYATLAPTPQLLWYGARAGLQVGAAVLAAETAVLLAIILAAMSVDRNGPAFATLFGVTPLAGTFFEPLWPVVVSLPVLPAFSMIGAVAALMRRIGNRRRRALDTYFSPEPTRLDFATFWVLLTAFLTWGTYAVGLANADTEISGLLTLLVAAAGLMSWPCHALWQARYLPLIRARGSVSFEAIQARIQQQL